MNPRKAAQNIRQTVVLPAGTGQTIKIAVFADGQEAEAAKRAGADIVGLDTIAELLDKQKISFDKLITTPKFMPKLAKYAKLLGPKGLMPNPKSGTITTNLTKAIESAKSGQIELRVDSAGIIHTNIGKASFSADKLNQNLETVLQTLKQAKPPSVKGAFIKSIHLTTTMGPSIKIEN